MMYAPDYLKNNIISICNKLCLEPVESILVSEDEYKSNSSICIVFKSGRCKIVEQQRWGIDQNKNVGDFIIEQLKQEIPYMDRKVREIWHQD